MFGKFAGIIFAGTVMVASLAAQAATLFETTELAGTTVADDAVLPQPFTFEVTTAGSYTIRLTDLRTPQALDSLQAIVTRDLSVVAQLAVSYPAAPALPSPASQSFMATPGTYRIHVLGIPDAAEAGGGFGVSVDPTAGGASLLDHADIIAASSTPSNGVSVLQADIQVAQAGTYEVTLADRAFPAALASTQMLLLQQTDAGPVVVPLNLGAFDATPGAYQLLIVATAAPPALAGLYSISVAMGSTQVYQSTQRVGNLQPGTEVPIATAGQHALTLADANFPASLASLAAVITQNGDVLGSLSAAGTMNIAAAQGVAEIYALATPTTTGGVGAFSLQLARAAQTVYADVRIADASADPTTPAIYAVASTAAVAAGDYQLKLEDFAFPLAFASLKAAAVQGATVLGTLNGEGTAQFTLQAGIAKILVAVLPPDSGSGNALFGMTLASSPGGTTVLETTQGVGGLFRTHTVPVTVAGQYDLTLQDLAFPSAMRTAALVITRGTTLVGQIFGGGTVPRQQLAAGTYVLNFLGQPATSAKYGTYGLKVADSPPQPTVTLSASPDSITSGQSTTLQWSSTNATTCTASGGWSGTKSATGSQSAGSLSANTKFDLSCTGPGGTGNASTTVTVSAPSASGGGGGGGMNLLSLAGLGMLAIFGLSRQRRSTRNRPAQTRL